MQPVPELRSFSKQDDHGALRLSPVNQQHLKCKFRKLYRMGTARCSRLQLFLITSLVVCAHVEITSVLSGPLNFVFVALFVSSGMTFYSY